MSRQPPQLSPLTKVLYSAGAASAVIKNRMITVFLLLYYSQVLGLSATTVATAILIATVLDAIFDPLVGLVSDRWRSRWGRRHPFMYLGAIPTSIALFLLWSPPAGISDGGLFVHLLLCLIVLRLFDTFFEVPSLSLVPELAPGYNQRTALLGLRQALAIVGGIVMVLAAYQIFLKEQPDGTGGLLDRDGYFGLAVAGAVTTFALMMISALSTHHLIPHLEQPPPKRMSFRETAREVGRTLWDYNVLVLATAGMITAVAMGMRQALETHFAVYYWALSNNQISLIYVASVPATVAGAVLGPALSAWIGKKYATVLLAISTATVTLAPIMLRQAGLLPADPTVIFYVVAVESVITQVLLGAVTVVFTSMVSDLVEDRAVRTGRRSEGILLSIETLSKKMVAGLGVFAAGLILDMSGVANGDAGAKPSAEGLQTMGALYVPAFGVVYLLAVVVVCFYTIDRRRHEANLAILEARASQEAQEGQAAKADLVGEPSGPPLGAGPVRP